MRYAANRSCSVPTDANWCRKFWEKGAQRRLASPGSDYGSCYVTELIIKSSVVAGRGSKLGAACAGCQKRGLVGTVTGRLKRPPTLPE
jgi:hypothetical protein